MLLIQKAGRICCLACRPVQHPIRFLRSLSMSLISVDAPVAVESLASTLQLPPKTLLTQTLPSPPATPTSTGKRASRFFSSLRASSAAARPALASLFKRSPSPPPKLALGHALPPLSDFGTPLTIPPAAVETSSKPILTIDIASPEVPPPSLAQIQKALDKTLPVQSPTMAPSTASSSSDSLSHYGEEDEPVMSVESLSTSFSRSSFSAPTSPTKLSSSHFVLNRPVLNLHQVPEEPEFERGRERKRSDASLLRHVSSQTFTRSQPAVSLKPTRSFSATPYVPPPMTNFPFRGMSPSPHTPPHSRSPSVSRSPMNLGHMTSASSSQASLSESVAVHARRFRRAISMSRPRRRQANAISDDSDIESDFEMMSPPRGAGWHGMQRYGGVDGLPPASAIRPRRGRTALFVRLDSGNSFDLGLHSFEAVRAWAARYGAISTIQVDSRKRGTAIKRNAESALRVEFRDPQTYERVRAALGSILLLISSHLINLYLYRSALAETLDLSKCGVLVVSFSSSPNSNEATTSGQPHDPYHLLGSFVIVHALDCVRRHTPRLQLALHPHDPPTHVDRPCSDSPRYSCLRAHARSCHHHLYAHSPPVLSH